MRSKPERARAWGAALLGCFLILVAAPHAFAASNLPPPAGVIPGLHPPPVQSAVPSDRSTGTTASGPVRAVPPHMPFYVATRGQVTIYVFGTLHAGFADDYPASQPFRTPILGALDASPILALEISPDDLALAADDVSKAGSCHGPCLPTMLPDALWKRLEWRLRASPALLAMVTKSRPWLASMLVETVDTLNAGYQTEYGSEAQLQNMYLRPRGRVVGLETIKEQLATFARLTRAQQWEMLEQDLTQTPAENMADARELHRLWRAGDADALKSWDDAKTAKLAKTQELADQVDRKVVYDRNARFVSRMVALATPNRPVFVAIGALHLGGKKGVLALLRKRGFVVDAA